MARGAGLAERGAEDAAAQLGASLRLGQPVEGIEFEGRTAKGLRSQAELVWTPIAELEGRGLGWNELPLFVPRAQDDTALMRIDNARAVAAGLACRPLAETARDTLAWSESLPTDQRPSVVPVR